MPEKEVKPAADYAYEEVKPDEINIVTDPTQLLEKVTALFNSLSPEEITDVEAAMDAMDEILKEDDISEADRQTAREYIRKLVQVEKDKITVITDPAKVAKEMEGKEMDVASDTEFSDMNDGYYDEYGNSLMENMAFE